MKFMHVITLCLFISISGCSPEQFELGTDLVNGSVTNNSLSYSFKKFQGGDTVQDLVNFLYFEGDTICFSFIPNGKYDRSRVKAWIVDPISKAESKIERLDFYPGKIGGFSLVGSVLEAFHRKRLSKPYPPGKFCCKDIPFIIKLKIGTNEYQKKGTFRITYK